MKKKDYVHKKYEHSLLKWFNENKKTYDIVVSELLYGAGDENRTHVVSLEG